MAGSLGAASIPFFACACLLVVLVLQILSFASPHWAYDGTNDFGLWRYARCIPKRLSPTSGDECYTFERAWHVKDWMNAARGLQCLAIIFWSIPIVVVPVYLYVALGLYYRCTIGLMTLFTLLGALCNIVGVIIFGLKIRDESTWDMEWCLIVSAVAGALGVVTFLLFLIALCKRPIFSSQTHLMSGFYVDPDRNKMYVVENVEDTKPGPLDGGHVNPAMSD